jgi:hypothetical protein
LYPVVPWRYGDPDYLVEAVVAWIMVSGLRVGGNLLFMYGLKWPRLDVHLNACHPAPAATPETPAAGPDLKMQLEDRAEHPAQG